VRTVNGVGTDIHLNNPADELNYLGDVSKPNNQWYGYPACFTVGGPGEIKDKTFSLGDQFVLSPNSTINDTTCVQRSVPPRLTFPAHSAPLDAKFDSGSQNLYVSLHGSWDRSPPTGFGLVRIPFARANDGSYAPVAARNEIGFIKVFGPQRTNGPTCTATTCVRPVGLVFDAAGRLYMTSDASGELFLIQKT
jgi:glucose/arabinose dehydrogenase